MPTLTRPDTGIGALPRRPDTGSAAARRQAPSGSRVLDTAKLGDHLDRLYRAAFALCGSRADADDLVQEVCARVLGKPRHVRGDDLGYLLGVLRNTFRSEYRTRRRRRTTPVEPDRFRDLPARGGAEPELQVLAHEIHAAIAALPDHYRDVIVAVDVLGLAYAEAATALGLPQGTVMSRLHRGRAAVTRQLGVIA